MRNIFQSIDPEKRQFFDAHYPTAKKDNKIATGGQWLSFATESIVFSTIIYNTFGCLIPAWFVLGVTVDAGRVFSVFLGMASALLLEVAIKNRTIDAVKGMLNITKFDGLYFRFAFLVFLYTISGATSFMGAKIIAEKVVPVAQEINPAGIDSMYYQKLAITNKSFASDSIMIVKSYNAKIRAVRMAAAAQIAEQKKWIGQFQKREVAEKKLFTTRIAAHQNNIKKYQAKKTAAISEIEEEKQNAIYAAHQVRTSTLLTTGEIYNKYQNKTISDNEKASTKREAAVFIAGNSLAAFTISMLAYLFFATRQYYKLLQDSGVVFHLHLSDHELSGGIFSEAAHILSEYINNKIRRPLYAMANKHAEKQKKLSEEKLYYFSPWNEYSSAQQQTTVVQTSPMPAAITATTATMPKATKPKAVNVAKIAVSTTAKGDVYGGGIGTTKQTTANGKKKTTANGEQRPTAVHICSRKECGKEYIKTVWNKRFCSETCKENEWRRLNPDKKLYKKRKK